MNTTEEFALISCLLNKPEFMERISSKIKPEYFEDEFCKTIYSKMFDLCVFTVPVLVRELKNKIQFKDILETQSLLNLVTKSTVESYAYIVIENYKTRAIKNLILDNKIDCISEKISEIQKLTFFEEKEVDESNEFLKNVEERYSGVEDTRNIKTGFFNIDSQIDGFRKSEAIFIGGRPGSGKTTIGMNIAYNMAVAKHKILFCSIEMGAIELHERLVKSITKINDYKKMSNQEFEKIARVSRKIKESLPIKIYDKPGMTIEDIIFKAKKETEENGVDCIFIDHLAILKSSRNFKSRYEEVSYLSGRIKALARELDIPIICLVQLNRALEGRDIKAPGMYDIRDSGSVEQDGDIIAFVYRPEYHLKDKEPDNKNSPEYAKWEAEMLEVAGKAQFIIAKNRRGFVGRFKFGFDGQNYTFYEREE